MSGELVSVPVPGSDDLLAVHDGEAAWASLRHMCDTLGIALDTQRRKLSSRSWAVVTQKVSTGSDGKSYQMTMLHQKSIPMWLATIDENRVKPDARPKLIAYQREAAAALDAYFNKRDVDAPPVNQFDALRAMIDQLEAAERDAAAAKALAERNEARLDGIEGRHDWFSALGYAKTRSLPTYEKFLRRLSRCAGMIAASHDITAVKVQHSHYGAVNSYPTWVWELAATGFEETS